MILGVALPTVMFGSVGFLLINFINNISGSMIPDQLRGIVALFWLFGVFLVTQRVVSAKPRIDADQILLTTVSTRTAVGGLLIAEFLRILSYISFPVLILSSLLAYALTAPAFLITVPFAIMLFSATVATAGSAAGYGIALLIASSPFVAKHKTALSIPAVLLGVLGYLGFQYSGLTGLDQSALAWFPAAWFADIAVLGGSIHGSLAQALGVLLGSCIFITAVGRFAEVESTSYWFSDGPILTDTIPSKRTTTGSGNHSEERKSTLANAVAPITVDFLPHPMQRVAQMVILRTWRDPQRLMFILMPVAIFIGSVISSANELDLFAVLPIASVVLIPWMAGTVFPLNPLGDEGSVLPVTLITIARTNYIRGLIAPSIILGLPAAVILTGITSLISPYPILTQFGLVVLAIYLTLVSAVLGSGIGMLLPRFNAISNGQADEVIPPRITAVTLHGIAVCIPGCLLALLLSTPELAQTMISILVGTLPGILLKLLATVGLESLAGMAAWFMTIGDSVQAMSGTTFRLTTISVLGIGGLIIAIAAYQGAIHRFDEFAPL